MVSNKNIEIHLDRNSNLQDVLEHLSQKLPSSELDSLEYQVSYPHIKNTIELFIEKKNKLSNSSTTLKLSKIYELKDVTLLINLDTQCNKNILQKIFEYFGH